MTAAAAAAAAAVYAALGWGIGPDALDSDTLSLIVSWRMLTEGVAAEHWQMAVPKPLLMLVDGALYEVFGGWGALCRSVLSAAALLAAAVQFMGRAYGKAAAAVVFAFLLVDRSLLAYTFGGNSTLAFAMSLAAAAAFALEWPSRRAVFGAGAFLFLAALLRQEGAAFLALGGAAALWQAARQSRPEFLRYAAGGAALGVAALLTNIFLVAPLTEGALSSFELARHNAEILRETHLSSGTEEGFFSTAGGFLARLLRPAGWYAVMAPLGLWALWARSRGAAVAVAALAGLPLSYCAAMSWLGLPLSIRFLLPAAVAAHLAAAAAYVFIWNRTALTRRRLLAGRAALAVLVLAVWAIAVRDLRGVRNGYLLHEAEARRAYRAGLAELASLAAGGPDATVLATGRYYPLVVLESKFGIRRVFHDEFLLARDAGPEKVRDFDYILWDEQAAALRRIAGAQPECGEDGCRLEIAGRGYCSLWRSRDDRFIFFSRTAASGAG